jgi:hypothetical protein
MSTFEAAAQSCGLALHHAVELYEWNARLSAAMTLPLHLFEVIVRNAVDEAVAARYGADWAWNAAFVRSLPSGVRGIDPRGELTRHAEEQPSTGKVIAELRFSFWEQMFTRRFVPAIWESGFPQCFPHAGEGSVRYKVVRLRGDIETVRRARNRIAHYEPVLHVPMLELVEKIERIAQWRSPDLGAWVRSGHSVRSTIDECPRWYSAPRRHT